ncbi:MAG: hypothetical protein QG670_1164 [Thermoproteota archaeon]|nr:hypothetical protein [Thermoproteota archaeon]
MERPLGVRISENELARRWKAVREAMTKSGLDCIVMQNNNQYMGGYFRYFTDMPAQTYGSSAVFPLDDGITIITSGPPQTLEWPSSYVKKRISLPYFPTINSTNTLDAKAVVGRLKSRRVSR